MTTSHKILIVGRDRAHVKKLVGEHPHAEVISASEFFDKIRLLAFLAHEHLRRDDFSVVVVAQEVLQKSKQFGVRYVPNFCSLYAAFYHGTSRPSDVYQTLSHDQAPSASVVEVLAAIDLRMRAHNLVTGVSALFYAWEVLKHLSTLPVSLRCYERVELVHLVDLTLLEMEVIKELSRRGLSMTVCFPMDFQRRGLNAAVDFSAKQFERCDDLHTIDLIFDNIVSDGPLRPLTDALFSDHAEITLPEQVCTITQASDLLSEADELACAIANTLVNHPTDSVAVAIRTLDARAQIFKHALVRCGIPVRDRKGVPLVSTNAFVLLEMLLSARMNHLGKRDLSGLMSNPLCSLWIAEQKTRADFLRLLDEMGIDDRISSSAPDRFHALIASFQRSLQSDDARLAILAQFEQWLLALETLLAKISEQGSCKFYLETVLELLSTAFVADDHVIAMREHIAQMARCEALQVSDVELSLREFVHLLTSQFATITIPQPDHDTLRAVELVLLPELLGRHFDHVFIVDITFGRLPFAKVSDPLLDDQARITLNQHLKKPLLRVFFDDPFEPLPVPPRQALEPFWFACAISAAKKSVHFSYAKLDESGQEQAPSEFFVWLLDHVTLTKEHRERTLYSSPEYRRFAQGCLDAQKLHETSSLILRARNERRRAFRDAIAGPYAFGFGPTLRERFSGRLDEPPTRALTPTMVEGFSACRFRGVLDRIVNVHAQWADADDIDARGIGQIGHRALELFFQSCKAVDHEGKSALLRKILVAVGEEFVANNFVANEMVLSCHLEWLHDALLSLISAIEEQGHHSQIIAQEIPLGLGAKKPLWLTVDDRAYLVGGRIDRIDRTPDGFLITDYKLSSIASLRADLASSAMLRRHFQMPIYVRLVAENFANAESVQFLFASIRDGALMPVLSAQTHPALFERIFDRADNNLSHAIDQIFAPLKRGDAVAVMGDHCSSCDFSFLCRKAGASPHE